MVLLLPLLVQDPSTEIDLIRRLKPKTTVSYEVRLTTIGEKIARHEYRLDLRILEAAPKATVFPSQFVMSGLTSDYDGQIVRQANFGMSTVKLEARGFPEDLSFKGNALAFSLPLLAFWLPSEPVKERISFEAKSPLYDQAITVFGEATASLRTEKKVQIRWSATLAVDGESEDQSRLRKLSSWTLFEAKDGLPLQSEGKYTAPDGTVKYTFRRL